MGKRFIFVLVKQLRCLAEREKINLIQILVGTQLRKDLDFLLL